MKPSEGQAHPGASEAAPPARQEAEPLPPPAPGGVVLRVHRARGEVVVAACDSELLESDVPLGRARVRISSHFYGRLPVSEEEFSGQVRRGTIVNLLGERTIAWAVRAGLLSEDGVGRLGTIPHAEIVNMPSPRG